MKNKEIISPFMEGAFSEPVLHKLVLSKIDFELSDEIWNEINAGFEHFWDVEVGVGNGFYFDDACQSIQKHLDAVGILLPHDKLGTILEVMFDFIEQIPGAILDDDEVVITEKRISMNLSDVIMSVILNPKKWFLRLQIVTPISYSYPNV